MDEQKQFLRGAFRAPPALRTGQNRHTNNKGKAAKIVHLNNKMFERRDSAAAAYHFEHHRDTNYRPETAIAARR